MNATRLALPVLLLFIGIAGAGVPSAIARPAPAPAPVPVAQDDDDPDKEFFNRSLVLWEPFERTVRRGAAVSFQFRVQRGYRTPVLSVIYPDGTPEYLRPSITPDGRHYEVAFRSDPRGGRHRIALIVDSSAGDKFAARFHVEALDEDGKVVDRDVDIPPADTEYEPLDREEHPLRVERHLFHRMNAFRHAQGLLPIPWNEAVARQCRIHAVEMRVHYEKTWNARVQRGELVHRLPGTDGPQGPTIAERMVTDEGWMNVVPKLPPADREVGLGVANYLSESLTGPDSSLDHKFEQRILRLSDLRAPMMSGSTTHAAGAAVWRLHEKPDRSIGSGEERVDPATPAEDVSSAEPEPVDREYARLAPKGKAAEAMTVLAFVQVNDPRIEQSMALERARVLRDLKRARGAAEEARAYRTVGQHAFADSPRLCEKGLKDRDAVVRAGALDGLWLCDPVLARARTDAWRLKILQAVEDGRFARVATEVRALAGVRYDARSGREGRRLERTIRSQARDLLEAAELAIAARHWREAADAFEKVKKDFDGFPEGEDAALALRMLEKHPEAGPALRE